MPQTIFLPEPETNLVKRGTMGVDTEDNENDRLLLKAPSVHLNGQSQGESDLVGPPPRSSKRRLTARWLENTGCLSFLRRLPTWRGVLILNYHRIGYAAKSPLDRNLWSATPEDFSVQLAIVRRDFDVIGLSELEDALAGRRGRTAMITFDDGYRDNYTHAFPALKQHNLTATFFVATGFIDAPRVPWWDEIAWMVRNTQRSTLPAHNWRREELPTDPAHADATITQLLKIYKGLQGNQTSEYIADLADHLETGRCPQELSRGLWMTWDQLREMRAAGMTIGGHSVTHPILASVSSEEQDFEVGECRRRLVAELGEPIDAFSYPVGGDSSFNQITAEALQRHGYRWAMTYLGGYIPAGRFDRYALQRAAVESDVDFSMFQAMLALPQVFA